MKIEMALLQPDYDCNKKLNFNEARIISEIEKLGEEQFFFKDIGLPQKGDFFKTKTHLCIRGSYFCIPLFVVELSEGESIENFSIFYNCTGDRDNTIELQKWPKRQDKKSVVWYFAEENYPAVGTIWPGYVDIIIKTKDKENTAIGTKKLWICPNSLSVNQFNQMLEEISLIPYYVFQLERNEIRKAYLGLDWKRDLEIIKIKIDKIEKCLRTIEKLPRGRLKRSKRMESYSKIKCFNSSVVSQYLKKNNNKKYLIYSPEHSLEIYEHRVFYNRFFRLRERLDDLTKDYKKTEKEKIENICKYRKDGENESIIKEKIKKNEIIKKEIKDIEKQETDIIDTIKKFFKLSIFKNIKVTNENWRITQILANDLRYRQVCKILKSLDLITTQPNVSDWKKIFVQKTDKIYEIWILAKIIELLKQQHWSLKNGKNTENDIYTIYNKFSLKNVYNNNWEWTLSGTFLHEKAHLEMDFFYNVPIDISLKIDKSKMTRSPERPDFLFRIRKTKEQSTDKIFILDVKYRNYKEQGKKILNDKESVVQSNNNPGYKLGEAYWLYEDVESVAYEKYIYKIKREYEVDVTASFIVHTDDTQGKESSLEYTGEFVTFNATSDKKWCDFLKSALRDKYYKKEKKQKRKEEFYKDDDDYKPDKIDAQKQQIGSFYMVPENGENNRSKKNLQAFFAMIFEYYMKVVNICWICGEVGEVIKRKDKEKIIEYKCSNCKCNHYWQDTHCRNKSDHRLIKHWDKSNNYHIISTIKPFKNEDSKDERIMKMAVCPICQNK